MNPSLRTGSNKDNETPFYIKMASVLVALICLVYILFTLSDIIIPLVFSVLIAILLHPVCSWLERKNIPRIAAVLLSILVLIGVLAVLVFVVSMQLGSLGDELPRITEKAELLLDKTLTMGEQYLNISRSQ